MKSPYFGGNVGAGWGPPPGIAQMVLADQEQARQGLQSLGKLAGGLTASGIGAVQAARDPSVFGSKVIDADGVPMVVDRYTPGQAARKGFWQNAANQFGGGGSGASGIQALMGGGNGGGGGGGGTPNFKQLQQGGKAADSFREMIKIGMPLAGEQEANVFGTDDEWKTLSATEKFSRVGQMFQAQQFQAAQLAYKRGLQDYAAQAQQFQAAQLAYKRGLQDYAAQAQQMAAAQQAQTANQQIAPWLQSYAAATTPTPGVPEQALSRSAISTLPPTLPAVAAQPGQAPLQAAATASRNYPLATSAPQFDNTIQSLARLEGLNKPPGWQLQPGQVVQYGNGIIGAATTPNSVQPFNTSRGGAALNDPNVPPTQAPPAGYVWKWSSRGWEHAPDRSTNVELPTSVQAQIAAISMQLANAQMDAQDPTLSAKVRTEGEKAAQRYAAQIDEIKKQYAPKSPAAAGGSGGGGGLWEQFLQSRK